MRLPITGALCDTATPEILGIPGLPLQQLHDSLLHGGLIEAHQKGQTLEGLAAIKAELQATLGFTGSEVRYCAAGGMTMQLHMPRQAMEMLINMRRVLWCGTTGGQCPAHLLGLLDTL